MVRREPENRSRRDEDVQLRDIDRIKEKVTIPIEPSSLVMVGVGVVMIVSVAFAIGYFTGHKDVFESVPTKASSVVDVVTVEAPPQKLDNQKEPVAIAPRATSGSVLPVPITVKVTKIEPRDFDTQTGKPAARKEAAKIPEPIMTPKPRQVGDAIVSLRREPEKIAPVNEDPLMDPGYWPGVQVTDGEFWRSCVSADGACDPVTPTAIAEKLEIDRPKAKAPVVVEIPVQNQVVKPKASPSSAKNIADAPRRQYEIQVRSFKERENAEEFAESLKAKGYSAHVALFVNNNGVNWYRVRTGKFKTSAEASAWVAEFNARENEDAIAVEVQ